MKNIFIYILKLNQLQLNQKIIIFVKKIMSRLRKNSENVWVGGILSGIGERLEMSETAIDIMRLAFLFLTLCTMFPGLIIYIVLLFIIPED